ncbi:MAG TPA: DUF6114 domain-containing protein [Pseudonocardia sp.]|jgi:hypothetical protein|nr:DUF6114 domain-containing protein [Pseudonocardia sp.]
MTPRYDEPSFGEPPHEPAHEHESLSPQMVALYAWAGERPWLGGTVTTLSGLAIAVLPNKGFTVVVLPGVAGLSGFVLGGLIIACGMFMLFSPQLHGILGIATVLLSLVSFVTTNIGGYVIGLLLGIVGGSLGFAWRPPDPD